VGSAYMKTPGRGLTFASKNAVAVAATPQPFRHKPLYGAMMFALGMAFSSGASATLAPDLSDSFINSNGADKTKNFGKEPTVKIGPTTSGLIQFNLSTLPLGTTGADV